MFVPISDENPLKLIRFGYVTLAIIVINIIVFLAFQLPDILAANDCGTLSFASVYGLVPIEFRGVGHLVIEGCPPVATSGFPEPLTIISYMFLHGDFWHILFNMLFLWVFGDNVEDALGHAKFAVFYLLCGIAGAHAARRPGARLQCAADRRQRCHIGRHRRLSDAAPQGAFVGSGVPHLPAEALCLDRPRPVDRHERLFRVVPARWTRKARWPGSPMSVA